MFCKVTTIANVALDSRNIRFSLPRLLAFNARTLAGPPTRRSLRLSSGVGTKPQQEIPEGRLPRDKARNRKVRGKDAPEAGPPKRLLYPHVLSARLKKLCDGGKVNDAVSMLQNAPLDAQNTPVWNTLILECMKARRFRLSYELFIDMKRRGFSPSTRTFQTMFSGLSRIENWQGHPKQLNNAHSLYEYFQRHMDAINKHDPDSPELTITPIASYIKILGDAGEYQRIFDVYYELDQEGTLSPNQFLFTAMFQAISQRRAPSDRDGQTIHIQNASDARLLWRQMLKASTRSPGFSVDPYIISAAIMAMSRGSAADQAFALQIVSDYLGLTQPGHPPIPEKMPLTVQTLGAALALCNHMQYHKLCIHFFKQVKNRPEKSGGVSIIDRGHMEEVLRAYISLAKRGSPEEPQQALKTLEWMLEQEIAGANGPKIRPTATTYNLVLMACWRGVDWACAKRTFELMTGYDTRDFEDGRDAVKTPRMEKRSKGRNLVPDAETMSCMLRTTLASRNPVYMREVLRMVHHLGLDNFFDVHPSSNLKEAARRTTFYQTKLAAALVDTIDAIQPTGMGKVGRVVSGEEAPFWAIMKRRAKELLRKAPKEQQSLEPEADTCEPDEKPQA